VKGGADVNAVDARSLNPFSLARYANAVRFEHAWWNSDDTAPHRSMLGVQSEVTQFLAEIMEKITPAVLIPSSLVLLLYLNQLFW